MRKRGKNSLNIAQLHWGFPPIIGGVETHLHMMLPEMVRRGHRVGLLTGSAEGTKVRYRYKGVEIFRAPMMDLNWLFKRGLQGIEEETSRVFRDFLDKIEPNIIHCHNMHYFSKVHAQTIEQQARKRGIPLVLTAHNSWDDILFLNLTRQIKWTHVIAVSHFIKKELMGAGLDDRKITVIHHGIDIKKFRPNIRTDKVRRKYPQLKDRRIVFHPARMGLAKGCDVSIKALSLVKERFPDVSLVLAGTKNIIDWGETQQKDIAYMVNLVTIFGLKKNVLIDAFSLEEMAQIYGLAQVCVYPSSVGEPFGLTMLEALASEKPMVVTDSGGMPEIIRDGINGFVVHVKDFEELASRVIHLLADQKLRHRLGYTGRQMVEAHYTKEAVTKNTIALYHKVIGTS